MSRVGSAEGASTSLSTTASVIAVPVPDGAIVGTLDLQLTSIVTATTLTVHLAADAAGDHAISPQQEVDIITGATTATDGGVSVGLNSVIASAPSWGAEGTIYVVAKTDDGTCTAVPRITWRGAP